MSSKPRILAVGAATQDVFLSGKVFTPVDTDKDGNLEENLPLGAKLEVEGVVFSTGGGAMNAAVTFARQGLDSAFMGSIGHDPAGQAVLAELDKENVDTSQVFPGEINTGYSVILLAPNGERTILTHRGASAHYNVDDYNLDDVEVDWLYLSSFAGQIDVLESLVSQAAKKGIKVALNPGKDELAQPAKLRALLEDITVLSANKEEMQQLVDGETIEELARHAAHFVDYVIVTDGPKGEAAVGQSKLVSGGMYEDVPVIDRTGAGDAFASGFTAMVALGRSLEEAVTFASANSTSVVGKIGAKEGILHAGTKLHDMGLKVKSL